jgi:hypothetical protein
MTGDREALREQYLAALEHEITSARGRLSTAREGLGLDAPPRTQAIAAVAEVTLEWLETERDRLRAGGAFDEDAARRLLAAGE